MGMKMWFPEWQAMAKRSGKGSHVLEKRWFLKVMPKKPPIRTFSGARLSFNIPTMYSSTTANRMCAGYNHKVSHVLCIINAMPFSNSAYFNFGSIGSNPLIQRILGMIAGNTHNVFVSPLILSYYWLAILVARWLFQQEAQRFSF